MAARRYDYLNEDAPDPEESEELRYLSDKVARFLFEFHAEDYQALQLPAIPSTASSGTIHKLLKTDHVWHLCSLNHFLVHHLLSKNSDDCLKASKYC